MNRNVLIIPILIAAFLALAYFWSPLQQIGKRASQIPETRSPVAPPDGGALRDGANSPQIISDNLNVPWDLAWLPDTSILITQRSGTLLKISLDGNRETISLPTPVTQVSESGLLGLTLHPNFSQNQFVYLYFTLRSNNNLINRVSRYKLENNTLTNEVIIVDNIPAGNFHDGGRIKFGPDGRLYITTGDAGQENLAQDPNSQAGKILSVGDDGAVEVYSLGHRNVQGLAWDSTGNLWATEHGRSGLQSGLDELNLIKPGKNYGWPIIQGDEARASLTSPVIQSGANETWAPSGAAFLNGSIFFAGLKGETLYEAKLNGEKVTELKRHFSKEFGRLRSVNVGPDGFLYLLTNNTDGRGSPKPNDDKLIRIDPSELIGSVAQ